jgi:hypothetical protein
MTLQIEYIEDGDLPQDMSKGLVFDNNVFQQLRETIKEHLKSKHALKKLQRDLRKEHQLLARDKKIEEEKTTAIEARCIEVQMLKFGQVSHSIEINPQVTPQLLIKKHTVHLYLLHRQKFCLIRSLQRSSQLFLDIK